MIITGFMAFGIIFLSIVFPLPMLILAHLMLSWENKGIERADYYAKKIIKISLISISVCIILAVCLAIWSILPGKMNLSVICDNVFSFYK